MDKVWLLVDQEFDFETESAIFRTLEGAKAAAIESMQQWYDGEEAKQKAAMDTIKGWHGAGPFTFSYGDGAIQLTRLEVQG